MRANPSEQRSARRASLYLSAALVVEGTSHPVTLRDISAGGAKVHTELTVPVGTPVELRRGELRSIGRVVWRSAEHMGIRFETPVAVDAWLLDGSGGQKRVDRLLARARAGSPASPAPAQQLDANVLRSRLGEEVGFAERLFEAIGETLADDPHVVAAFSNQLQSFELGCKILQNVAHLLSCERPEEAVEHIGLHEMKARLLRG